MFDASVFMLTELPNTVVGQTSGHVVALGLVLSPLSSYPAGAPPAPTPWRRSGMCDPSCL